MDLLANFSTWSFDSAYMSKRALQAALAYFPGATFSNEGDSLKYSMTGSIQYDLVVAKFMFANGGTLVHT